MAEVVVSPGVFLRENDLSQVTEGPITAGAALIGPTVIGPILRPTVVTSYSDYKRTFGAAFVSGGLSYEYFTSIAALNYFEQGGNSLLVTRVTSGSATPATASIPATTPGQYSFVLETLSEGDYMNNYAGGISNSGSLISGSTANVRWEVVTSNSGSGNFTLIIRRGDDFDLSKTILETYTNLSLDPNSGNYIEFMIGNSTETYSVDEFGNAYLQPTGSYANKSKYVRVKSVDNPTPNYLDINGTAKTQYTGSMPKPGTGTTSGSFGGAIGDRWGFYGSNVLNMYDKIPSGIADSGANNIQGLKHTDYQKAIDLLKNKEAYDYNIIYAPGLTSQNGQSTLQNLIEMVTNRGDAIAVVDMVTFGQSINTVTQEAAKYDNNYASSYWPWLQVRSRETGKTAYVPASTLVPAIYEYNDNVSAEWFAPAGLNRGGMATVLRPERKLDTDARNFLYQGKVNPIAQFAGVGTVIYGQKTLQNRASALDRVNVRRLMISMKRYIKRIAEDLLFEPNTQVTRNKFLGKINPYLEFVQQRQGIYAFQVVMDETNNTSDLVDRNQLVGAVYIQPTRVAEFITIDFNILPTGATFGA